MEKNENIIHIGIGKLKEGMVLAGDLRDLNGRLLLKKGGALTTRDLRIMKMWGVTEARIDISGTESKDSKEEEKPQEPDEKTINSIKEIFRFSDMGQEFNRELERLLQQRAAGSASEEADAIRRTFVKRERKAPGKQVKPVDIKSMLKGDIKLPSLPAVVVKINEAIQYPNCTATHIADIISKDSSLSANLLRLVNSAFYNFPMPVESIGRAVTIIGTRQVSSLATASAVTSTFQDLPPDLIDMKSFWKHSVACGILSRLLASYKKNLNTESYFLAGLLHDIGRLILFQHFPQHAQALLYRSQNESQLLYRVEKHMMQEDHAELGSHLIEQWKLPPVLEHGCRYHHNPMESPDPTVSSIVHTADIIANAMRFGTSGEYYAPPLAGEAWETIGLPGSVMAPIIQQTDNILNETIQLYLGGE